jgi:phospholipid/cholesterol/gamma-HCH transport system substrate-binding protein
VRRRSRINHFTAGILGVAFLAIVCYLVFGGSLPFSGTPYQLKAVFTTQTQLHIPSEVRSAGVKVGEVVSVKRMPGQDPSNDAAVVTMDIQNNGLPIHADATVNVRPRIFLEGNFYVDLRPGTPGAPILASGSTLPAPQTSGPVQIDRVLAALNTDARANLQTLLQGIGSSLNVPAPPSQDVTQDPSTRRLTGGQALNLSLKYSVDAFRASSMVNQALLGLQPHDLSGVVKGNEQVFRALSASGPQLPAFVDSFNATMAALASRELQLSQTIALLPPWLQATDRLLRPLNASFGPTKRFAQALTQQVGGMPAIEQLDPTITAALPWLKQSIDLVSNRYLGGLLKLLTPAVQDTSASLTATKDLLTQANSFARCFTHNILPAGNEVIQDPPGGNTGLKVYQEFFQSAVGLGGAAQNFDGNGRYMRASAGGGSIRFQTSSVRGAGPLFGNAVLPLLGTRPAYPGGPPPVVENVACYKNPAPALNRVTTGAAP